MINLSEIGDVLLEAAVRGLDQGAQRVAALARSKAPVRHLFAGSGTHVRFKSIDEIEVARGARGPVVRAGSPPVHWRERRLAAAQALLEEYDAEQARRSQSYVGQKTILDRRGAYEVRTKRAQFTTWGHAGIGGRLRGSISAQPALIEGSRAEAWVIATAPYAKYQEFGTRHNAAHPFLRPAAEESRGEVVGLIADAVREAARTGGSSTEIEIVVRI